MLTESPKVIGTMNTQLFFGRTRTFILSSALVCGGIQGLAVPAVLAHSGHGDEFVQNGVVDQVKFSPDQDLLNYESSYYITY